MKPIFAIAIVSAICGAGLTGCSMFEGDDDKRNTVTDSSMYSGVPANAIRATSGNGTIRYRATSNSRVIIGDDVRRSVITETSAQAGEEIVVDAEGDSVTVNGRVVFNQNLEKNNQHSIFIVNR